MNEFDTLVLGEEAMAVDDNMRRAADEMRRAAQLKIVQGHEIRRQIDNRRQEVARQISSIKSSADEQVRQLEQQLNQEIAQLEKSAKAADMERLGLEKRAHDTEQQASS